MKIIVIFLISLLFLLSSCHSPGGMSPRASARSSNIQSRHQQQTRVALYEKADNLVDAGIQYYYSGELQEAVQSFSAAEGILKKIEAKYPRAKTLLIRARAYLDRIVKEQSDAALRFAERQIENGGRQLSAELLDGADLLLEHILEWDPNLKGEVDTLKKRIKSLRERVH